MTQRDRWLPALVFLGVVVFLIGLAKHRAYVSGDGWLYVAIGRDTLAHGIAWVDQFAYTSPDRLYVNKLFGATLVWATIVDVLGERALYLFAAGSGVVVLVTACFQTRVRWQARLSAIPLVIILLGVDGQLFEARAQNPGHLLFIAALALLDRADRLRPRALLAWTALAVLWTNWHPSFLLVIVLPLVFAAFARALEPPSERPRGAPLLVLGATSLVASLVTPYGFDLLRSSLLLLVDPSTSGIDHMQSPTPGVAWTLFVLATVGVIALRAMSPRAARRTSDVALVVLFLAMTLVSARYAALSFLVTVRVLLPTVDDLLGERGVLSSRERAAIGVLAIAAAVFGGALLLRGREPYLWGPRSAVDWIDAHQPSGRVMNEFAHGGYLMYRWGPARRVFIDGRNDLYDNGVFTDYGRIASLDRAGLALLDVYGVNTVISGPMGAFHPAFDFLKAWRLAFEGEDGVVYVRREPLDTRVIRPPQALAGAHDDGQPSEIRGAPRLPSR